MTTITEAEAELRRVIREELSSAFRAGATQTRLMAEAPLKEQWPAERAAETDPATGVVASRSWPEHEPAELREPDPHALSADEMFCPECHGRGRWQAREVFPGDGPGVIKEILVGCPRCKGSGVIPTFDFGIRSEKVSGGRNA